MKKLMKFILSFAILTALILPITPSALENNELTILFTHDLHDNIESYDMEIDGSTQSRGGYARLYSAILKEREVDENLLLVDAGDYSMGTLFQTIFTTDAPTLRLMGHMGYDATTLGNHEFDFRAIGLAESLIAAKDSKDKLPEIVASNTQFPKDSNPDLDKLQQAFEYFGVKDYTVFDKGGVKVGVFGLMGIDADSNAPMAEVEFANYIEAAKRVIKILKDDEKVDIVVALSHSGTDGKSGKTEDEMLAKETDVDVIISGHSHTTLNQPILLNNTIIASAGRYGENLGVMMIVKEDNYWKLNEYKLKPIDNTFMPNEKLTPIIDDFRAAIDDVYLAQFNLSYNQVIAHSPFSFTPALKLGKVQEEEPLANLIGDAYIHAVKTAEGSNYKEIDVAVVPKGVIRDSIVEGDLTVKDIFNISPLGIGKDKISGYPLIDVYLTGKELKAAAEVDASIQPLMSAAQLYMSGLEYSFNPNRIIFNKVVDINLVKNGNKSELVDDQLYRVVANLYTAQMLNIVGDKSMGILSIVPKDENGNVVDNFEDRIIYDGSTEVKEWVALTSYLASFDKKDGVPQISEKYSAPLNRKIVNNDTDLVSRFEKPNIIAMAIYSIILILILLIIFIVRFVVKRLRRRKLKQYQN